MCDVKLFEKNILKNKCKATFPSQQCSIIRAIFFFK